MPEKHGGTVSHDVMSGDAGDSDSDLDGMRDPVKKKRPVSDDDSGEKKALVKANNTGSDSDSDVDNYTPVVVDPRPWYQRDPWKSHQLIHEEDFRDLINTGYSPLVSEWRPLSTTHRPYCWDKSSRTPAYKRAPFPNQVPKEVEMSFKLTIGEDAVKKVDDFLDSKRGLLKSFWMECEGHPKLKNYYDDNEIGEFDPCIYDEEEEKKKEEETEEEEAERKKRKNDNPGGTSVVYFTLLDEDEDSEYREIKFPRQALYVLKGLDLNNKFEKEFGPIRLRYTWVYAAIKVMEMAGPGGDWPGDFPGPPGPVRPALDRASRYIAEAIKRVYEKDDRAKAQRQLPPRQAAKLGRESFGSMAVQKGLQFESESESESDRDPHDSDFEQEQKTRNMMKMGPQRREKGISIQDAIDFYKQVNKDVFKDDPLPAVCRPGGPDDDGKKIPIVWMESLRRASGRTDSSVNRQVGPKNKVERILLSSYLIGRLDDLRNTLAHEMCHVHDVLNGISDGHGPNFKATAARIEAKFGDVHIQEFCDGCRRYLWECTNPACGLRVSRNTRTAVNQSCHVCKNPAPAFRLVRDRGARLDGRRELTFHYKCLVCGAEDSSNIQRNRDTLLPCSSQACMKRKDRLTMKLVKTTGDMRLPKK